MKCPECNQELNIPTNTYLNMESYMNSCVTITDCCGKLINVHPSFSYKATKYSGKEKTDDWNREEY